MYDKKTKRVRHALASKSNLRMPNCALEASRVLALLAADNGSALLSLRIFLEDVGIVLSTREQPELRQRLVLSGVTHLSAGSKTDPGGYHLRKKAGNQFDIADTRTPKQVADALKKLGLDPVFKDWDTAYG